MKKILVCMVDSIFRLGLVNVLKELEYVVNVVATPNEIQSAEHRHVDYLIVGDDSTPIVDRVLDFSERTAPKATAVIVKTLKLSEVSKLKSLGVHAILSMDTKPAELTQILLLLPEHWIINTGILIPEGLVASTHPSGREWQVLVTVTFLVGS